ncbi:MAG: hypothetical protein L3J65_11070 [Robiginitomaculum sp.]|nr:hypothetical protein [Robiginitomaculum sp.]
MIGWSFLLKPKVLAGLGGIVLIVSLGLFVRGEIRDYGKTQYNMGKLDCETAVRNKVAETKRKLDGVQKDAQGESAKTETVYVTVTKEVAVTDARVAAENAAMKNTIENLETRISNAKPDKSNCASEPVPADSLRIHTEIDRLLRSD